MYLNFEKIFFRLQTVCVMRFPIRSLTSSRLGAFMKISKFIIFFCEQKGIIMEQSDNRYYLTKDDASLQFACKKALEDAVRITERNMEKYKSGEEYPIKYLEDNTYTKVKNAGPGTHVWTESFWTGMLWLCYEVTEKESFRLLAEKNLADFYNRVINNIEIDWHHDIGFLYTLAAVAPYKLTGNDFAKKTALLATDYLINRFRSKGEFIQSAGFENDEPSKYRFIADTMMNLPLLFWASEVTGEEKYRDAAIRHANTTRQYIIRSNGGVYHHYLMDQKTGAPLRGLTLQGSSDDSYWSRAQAWVIYGLAIEYSYTKSSESLEAFYHTLDFFIDHLPTDFIPYWDFIYNDGDDEPRDSSAGAIAVCGILEMAKHVAHDDKMTACISIAKKMLTSLTSKQYAISFDDNHEGLLKHTTPGKPQGLWDTCCIYGDYYYMEALVRATHNWNMYW